MKLVVSIGMKMEDLGQNSQQEQSSSLEQELIDLETDLEASTQQLGAHHKTTIQLKIKQAELYLALGELPSALENSVHAKRLAADGLFPGHPLHLQAMCVLASIYEKQGDRSCAEELRGYALNLLQSRELRSDREVSMAIELAEGASASKNSKSFFESLMQNVSLEKLPANTKELLYAKMANMHHLAREDSKANDYFDALFCLPETRSTPISTAIPQALLTYAKLKREEEDYFEARAILLRALVRANSLRSDEHAVQALSELISLSNLLEKHEEAKKYSSEYATVCERHFGQYAEQTTLALIAIGQYHYSDGELAEARGYLERALFNLNQQEESPHQLIAEQHHNLGVICCATGDYELAQQHLHEAYSIRAAILGEAHEETTLSLFALATLHKSSNNLEEARRCLSRVIEILERDGSAESSDYQEARRMLCELDDTQDSTPEDTQNLNHEKEEQQVERQEPSETHQDVAVISFEEAVTLFNQASIASGSGDLAQAYELLLKALPVFEATLGETSQELLPILQQLETASYATGDIPKAQECYRRVTEIKKS